MELEVLEYASGTKILKLDEKTAIVTRSDVMIEGPNGVVVLEEKRRVLYPWHRVHSLMEIDADG